MLEQEGAKEGNRRRLMSEWRRVSDDNFIIIQRAEYWTDVYRQYAQQVADEVLRRRIDALTDRMDELQAEVNGDYVRFQQLVTDMAENQKSLNVVNGISTLLSLVQTGMEVGGKFTSASGKDTKSEGSAQRPIEDIITYRQTRELEMKDLKLRLEVEVSGGAAALRNLD